MCAPTATHMQAAAQELLALVEAEERGKKAQVASGGGGGAGAGGKKAKVSDVWEGSV